MAAMNYLTNPLLDIKEYKDIIRSLEKNNKPVNITGPSDSQKVHLCHALVRHTDSGALYITHNELQARKAYEDFKQLFGEGAVFMPSREIILFDIEARSNDSLHKRISAIEKIIEKDYRIVVTTAEALFVKLPDKEVFLRHRMEFNMDSSLDFKTIENKLYDMGYERVAEVEGKGQFSIRGGIIDIFSVNTDNPVRIELFGDDVDSIRLFDKNTQRSMDNIKSVKIPPAKELIIESNDREHIAQDILTGLEEHISFLRKKDKDIGNSLKERIARDIERFREEKYFPGMDRYIPYILSSPASIIDYLKDEIVFWDEPSRIEQSMKSFLNQHSEVCQSLLEKGVILPKCSNTYFMPEKIQSGAEGKRTVKLNMLSPALEKNGNELHFNIDSRSLGSYHGKMNILMEDIKMWKAKGNRILVFTGSDTRVQRFYEELSNSDIDAVIIDNAEAELEKGQIGISSKSLNSGFEYVGAGLVLISENELYGKVKKPKKAVPRPKKKNRMDLFAELNTGDYVVHQTHGIGRYAGMKQLTVDSIKKDYLKIRYRDGDLLYIPTSQMDLVQKYIGAEGKAPRLNKLGGNDWLKTKNKVKESLKELAFELIKLYAQRESLEGYAFSKDTVWQKQFEEMFVFEETGDQIRAIGEIKKDMETRRPVDRLLCGDVGYGKTEVAMRAAFKAVMDGKQVAYLVPTTVLAQQHYMTFTERMQDFPVTVDVISRFRSRSEQVKIQKNLKAGNIDILIGTHRLLQNDVKFKELGLLIVDEEQRFGVGHKEQIKNMSPTVDVITLTATPIPRTLHMSLTGIRDISVLEQPPEERYPVQTYVMEYDEQVVKDAILKELGRGGQVFYLFNRVRSIDLKAGIISELVPEARVAVAHGQMDERRLESIMMRFVDGEFDVLVCTTIIESGLDMPNVNTIIVEDADKMGLSQLYQLRGRVGRSNRLAHAYITYRKDKVLSEIAEKRLKAIKEFTEFGSGFKVAMRDLEIRGAGNLLGPQQHGHIATVGYDMYCKLLDQSVRELKGEHKAEKQQEISIDINVSAYIDKQYINSEAVKIEMYKKIAAIESENDVRDIKDELIDRFGEISYPVYNLIEIAYIKSIAAGLGISAISQKKDKIIFSFSQILPGVFNSLGNVISKYKRKILFNAGKKPYLMYKTDLEPDGRLLNNIKILLQDIKSFEMQ